MSTDLTAPDTAEHAVVDRDHRSSALQLYRQMLLIRRFEDAVQSLFQRGEIHGTTHLYSGQEAVAVGVASALGPNDRVAGTYRGHGHALALGVEPQGLMDELLGRGTGVCGGRGGSMNVIDLAHRLVGCYGIIGGSIAAATGAALSVRRVGGVAVAFFGDGTMNQAYFTECANFAAVQRLPVVYVCENNLYGEFTPWEDVTAGEIAARPKALGIPTVTIDGNDVWTVAGAARSAVEHARSGAGPAFIEALTYRLVGHSRSDPGRYRKPGELEAWRSRDPLLQAERRLGDEYAVSGDEIGEIQTSVDAEIAEVVRRGLAAPPPPTRTGSEFADPGWRQRRSGDA